jgi:ATPase subunit of ABC transporter with duplicated ATPase domains
VSKGLQLHLACEQRIGVILVGPTGAGKTTLWRMLEGALARLGRGPTVHRRARAPLLYVPLAPTWHVSTAAGRVEGRITITSDPATPAHPRRRAAG